MPVFTVPESALASKKSKDKSDVVVKESERLDLNTTLSTLLLSLELAQKYVGA